MFYMITYMITLFMYIYIYIYNIYILYICYIYIYIYPYIYMYVYISSPLMEICENAVLSCNRKQKSENKKNEGLAK